MTRIDLLDEAYRSMMLGFDPPKPEFNLARLNDACERIILESDIRRQAMQNVRIGLALEEYAKTGISAPVRSSRL